MKILIVSATIFEIQPLINFLQENYSENPDGSYKVGDQSITILVTGVGIMQTTFELTKTTSGQSFDFAINLGVCGSFDRTNTLGDVVEIITDRMGDLGAEDADGTFMDAFDMNLDQKDKYPYQNGWISKLESHFTKTNLTLKKGITVNKVTGSNESIFDIQKKYQADVESMEGAAFFFVCAKMNIPSIQVRAISNYVEARNKANWKMEEAIHNLKIFALSYLNIKL